MRTHQDTPEPRDARRPSTKPATPVGSATAPGLGDEVTIAASARRDRTLSHVALGPEARQALVGTLNQLLASTIDLYTQVKQAHWNVKGMEFQALHTLFDELGARILIQADDLAERASQLGGYVRGTARQVAEGSRLAEYDLDALDGMGHVRALLARYATLDARLRDAIEEGERHKDPVTVDLLTGVARVIEKDLWFLESHLN